MMLADGLRRVVSSLGYLSLTVDVSADRLFTPSTKPLLATLGLATTKADFTSKGEHGIGS
jgi:hypothetical protein